ncbi:hypothetical protein ACMDB5_08375 [Flavobacterium sp. W1B]|uniref:hypothetical protein n=1 Tax=Flavobacterium sp. W1B TaxID=3394146 RepID=UPI0039BC6255
MYKLKNKIRLEQSKHFGYWIKRKLILIISTFMIGMSNAMYHEDKMVNGNQNHTEQQHKKE